MTMRAFLKAERELIDGIIRLRCPGCPKPNDAERENWVRNDEALYQFARIRGVRV